MELKRTIFDFIRKRFRIYPIEIVLCGFSQNKSLDSFIGKLIPGNNLYRPNTIRNVSRDGINFTLDISDYQNWLIYYGINADRPEGLFELVKTQSVIFDVGGNIGQTTLMFAKIAGENSTVIGFEPDPVNYAKALYNFKKNAFTTIQYFNTGLGSKTEQLFLEVNAFNSGGNKINRTIQSDGQLVQIERLDEIVMRLQLKQIDLIKIDVEGFEFEVLKGAENSLKQFKPALYIEIDDSNLKEQNTSPKELIKYLHKFDYIIRESKTKKILTGEENFENVHFDVVCS